MLEREAFKDWFSATAIQMGVTKVEFRKANVDLLDGFKLFVGNYNVQSNDIWVIEEWKNRYLPTPHLIYFSMHELGHHVQFLQRKMNLSPEGLVPKKYLPGLELDAHKFASQWSLPLIGRKMGPLSTGVRVMVPFHGE